MKFSGKKHTRSTIAFLTIILASLLALSGCRKQIITENKKGAETEDFLKAIEDNLNPEILKYVEK